MLCYSRARGRGVQMRGMRAEWGVREGTREQGSLNPVGEGTGGEGRAGPPEMPSR